MEKNDWILKGEALERHFEFQDTLLEFHRLFTYESKDERTIAILGGTFLEMLLDRILYAFLPDNNSGVKDLMKTNQPLSNFSNKIQMCYYLGLIDTVIKDDLNLIRKIRNVFAHDLYADFSNDNIKSWCLQLKWHKILIPVTPPAEASPKDYFQVGTNTLISHLDACISFAEQEKRHIKKTF